MNNLDLQITIRFLTKINHIGNCWEWKGCQRNGYGRFNLNGKTILSHRFSYELFKELIPKGLTIDHLCKNKLCVNPEHLEAVTQRENILRGVGTAAINSKKTNCPKGHELKEPNLVKSELRIGRRNCRICWNQRAKLNHNKENG